MIFRESKYKEWLSDRKKWLLVQEEALRDLRSAKKRKQLAYNNLKKQDDWLLGQKQGD